MALLLAPRRLADAHWRRLERIRATVIAATAAQWQRQPDAPPIEQTVLLVLAAQRLAVTQTDAYLAAAAAATIGGPFEPVGLDADRLIGRTARHGVPLEEVYRRAAKGGREAGFQRGLQLLRQSIITDVGLAQRNASHAAMAADDSTAGWRRVVNPGAGKVCGMCVAASTRVYGRGDLQPIHRSCRCTVQPIYDSAFTGRTLDRERLQAVYDRSGGATDFQTLSRIRIDAADLPRGVDSEALEALNVRIVNDPELGPMLDADRHDTAFALA